LKFDSILIPMTPIGASSVQNVAVLADYSTTFSSSTDFDSESRSTAVSFADDYSSAAYHQQHHHQPQQHSLLSLLIICFSISLMIIATLIGNALIMLAVLLVRKLKQPANFLLVSLAFADFCVGLLVMPLALVDLLSDRWILGEALCRLWTSADQTLCTASIINLCMISVDRYCAVSRPLRYAAQRTRKRICCYVLIVWIVALIVSVSPLVIWPAKRIEGTCQVNQNAVYQIYATTIAFYGPTMIMIILYVKMWLAAKRLTDQDRIAKKSINGFEQPTATATATTTTTNTRKLHRPSTILQKIPLVHNGKVQERREGKARKTLGVIMSVFIVCWVPFFLIALLKPHGIIPPRWLDHLVLWLGYSNRKMSEQLKSSSGSEEV
uniref:5-hydroxytryptamine receptor 7 (inferred by orthology to a human protein) n=1 Tax=Anisakis simplex TaxID=6269 RepID=A0A158PNA6_ANISI